MKRRRHSLKHPNRENRLHRSLELKQQQRQRLRTGSGVNWSCSGSAGSKYAAQVLIGVETSEEITTSTSSQQTATTTGYNRAPNLGSRHTRSSGGSASTNTNTASNNTDYNIGVHLGGGASTSASAAATLISGGGGGGGIVGGGSSAGHYQNNLNRGSGIVIGLPPPLPNSGVHSNIQSQQQQQQQHHHHPTLIPSTATHFTQQQHHLLQQHQGPQGSQGHYLNQSTTGPTFYTSHHQGHLQPQPQPQQVHFYQTYPAGTSASSAAILNLNLNTYPASGNTSAAVVSGAPLIYHVQPAPPPSARQPGPIVGQTQNAARYSHHPIQGPGPHHPSQTGHLQQHPTAIELTLGGQIPVTGGPPHDTTSNTNIVYHATNYSANNSNCSGSHHSQTHQQQNSHTLRRSSRSKTGSCVSSVQGQQHHGSLSSSGSSSGHSTGGITNRPAGGATHNAAGLPVVVGHQLLTAQSPQTAHHQIIHSQQHIPPQHPQQSHHTLGTHILHTQHPPAASHHHPGAAPPPLHQPSPPHHHQTVATAGGAVVVAISQHQPQNHLLHSAVPPHPHALPPQRTTVVQPGFLYSYRASVGATNSTTTSTALGTTASTSSSAVATNAVTPASLPPTAYHLATHQNSKQTINTGKC